MRTMVKENRYLRLLLGFGTRGANCLSIVWHAIASLTRGLWQSVLRLTNWLANRPSLVWVWLVSFAVLVMFGLLVLSADCSAFGSLLGLTGPYDTESSRYLLSAIFQGLAAVFALVFTISLVIGQVTTRYSYRMFARIYNLPTLLYALLFIASVLLPLLVLGRISEATPPPPGLIRVNLLMGGACIIFLVPYFWAFKRKLNPEEFVQDTARHLVRRLWALVKQRRTLSSEELKRREPEELKTIREVAKNACSSVQYDVLEVAIRALSSAVLRVNRRMSGRNIHERPSLGLVLSAIEDVARQAKTQQALEILTDVVAEDSRQAGAERLWQARGELMQCLRILADLAIEYEGFQRAVELAVSGLPLDRRSLDFSDKEFVWTWHAVIDDLRGIGIGAAHAGLDYVPFQCVAELRILCEQLYETKVAVLPSDSLSAFVSEILDALVAVGEACIEMKLDRTASLVMGQLESLETRASPLFRDERRSTSEFRHLKSQVRRASRKLHKVGGEWLASARQK